jgi:hypothetical protein
MSIFDVYKSNDKKYISPIYEFIKTYCAHCTYCAELPNPNLERNCALFNTCQNLVKLDTLKKIEIHIHTLLSQQQIPWQTYLSKVQPNICDEDSP